METRVFFHKLQTPELLELKRELDTVIKYRKDKNYVLITDINYSVRACLVLRAAGIKYVEELATLKRTDCLKWRNCGWRTMKELEVLLKEHGLKWLDEESLMDVYEVGIILFSGAYSNDDFITVKASSFNHAEAKAIAKEQIGRGERINRIRRL